MGQVEGGAGGAAACPVACDRAWLAGAHGVRLGYATCDEEGGLCDGYASCRCRRGVHGLACNSSCPGSGRQMIHQDAAHAWKTEDEAAAASESWPHRVTRVFVNFGVDDGLGRIVALYHCSPASYRNH